MIPAVGSIGSSISSHAGQISQAVTGAVNLFGGIGSNIFSNRTNKKIARDTNLANLQLWMLDSEFQKKMWELQNEYNLPENVKQRYIDAGINPALAMSGQGIVGTAGTMNASHPTPAQPYESIPIMSGVDLTSAISSIAQVKKIAAEERLLNSEAALNESKAKFSDQYNEAELNSILSVIRSKNIEANLKKWELESGKKFFDATFDARVTREEEQTRQVTLVNFGIELENKLKEKNLYWIDREKQAQIVLLQAQARQAIANAALAGAMREKTVAETKKVIEETALVCEQKTSEILRQTGLSQSNQLAKDLLPVQIRQAIDEAYKVHKESRAGYIYFSKVLDALGLVGGVAAGAYTGARTLKSTMNPAVGASQFGRGFGSSFNYNPEASFNGLYGLP